MGDTAGEDGVDAALPQEANVEDLSLEKLYDYYTQANDLAKVMKSFVELKKRLELTNLQGIELYREFRTKLKIWKAGELFDLLDKRAKQKEYKQQNAAKGKRVLIVGAGPVGLRTAVDCVLLGCDVVVVEKRNAFTRNNVLHLWPFTIEDLRQLGAKKFWGKFCAGAIDHVSIRTLQCILLKTCLLLGVTIYTEVEFVKILEPDESLGWHASFKPTEHRINQFDFDVLVGTDGKKSCIPGFDRKELRGKLALAITANFVNYNTKEEAACDEISGVAFIFNQKFFKDLKQDTGIDLENIVYYRDDTHYFVMTAKKESLLEKKVIRADYPDTQQLLDRSNVDHEKLCQYAYEAAEWSTDLPRLDFALNHYDKEDVFLFDFTSIHAAECSARAIRRNGKDLIMCLAGDSLLEPFWPIGTGCARGFLSAMDTAWMIQGLGQGKHIVELLCERESIYQRLPQTTPEKLHQSIKAYTIDPMSRYPHLNTQVVKPADVGWLYDTGNEPVLWEHPPQQKNVPKRHSMPVVGVSIPPLATPPAPITKEKLKEVAKETAKPAAIQEAVGGASNASPSHTLSPGRKGALEKGNVTRAYFGEDASSPALKDEKTLLKWLQDQLKEYKIDIKNLTDSWKDGMGLCALIHHYHPELIPQYSQLSPKNSLENNTLALTVAEDNFGFTCPMTPGDFSKPDKLAMLTYLSLYYEFFSTKDPVPLKKERSSSLWSRLSRKKKKNVAEESAPAVKRGWNTTTTRNQRKPSGSMSPTSSMSASGTQKGSSPESWRSPSPGEEPFSDTSIKDKETSPQPQATSPQPEASKTDGKAKSSRKGSKSSKKGKDATKEEEGKAQAEGTKKETPPPSTPSKPATQQPQASSTGDTPTTQAGQAPPSRGKANDPSPVDPASSKPLSLIAGTSECSDYCYFCYKRVYLMERMSANGLYFHRNCFKCTHCKMQLGVGGYALSKGEGAEKGKFFCTAHYRQLFLSNPEAINYSRANPGAGPRPTPTPVIPEEPHLVPAPRESASRPHPQTLEPATPVRPKEESESVVPVRSESPKKPPHNASPSSLRVQAVQPQATVQQQPPANQTNPTPASTVGVGGEGEVAEVSKLGQCSPGIKPARPAPPPPVAGPKAPEVEAVKEGVATQASPKMPQKPAPYGSTNQRSSVADLTQQCNNRDSEVVGGVGGRSRMGSGLPPKSTVRSPTRDTRGRTTKNPGRKTVARHLVNSPKDSDIEERQRMQRKIHQAQEIQREMSLLERQNEELEINSREVEEALRDSDGTDDETTLMKQWLALVNERNGLVRRTAELSVQWKELELEDKQYEIEKELSELFCVTDKTPEEQGRFEELLEEKMKIIEQRNDLIDQTEEDRIRELEEDAMHKSLMENMVQDDSTQRASEDALPYMLGPYAMDKARSKVRHSVA